MTDKKFTDKEIIKGLTELILHAGFQEKRIQVLNASLDLINRQKETIETLRKCVEQHHIIRKDSKSPLSLLTAEIRAEAYKEFAEKAVIRLTDNYHSEYSHWIDDTIDTLLKEMVGEE